MLPKNNTNYWLAKSEPSEYSIDDLSGDGESYWFGVRNYQVRNFMRDEMQEGDMILFYHSSCKIPGIYGLARVVSTAVPDATQFDMQSKYFDSRATREKPIWFCPKVGFVRKFPQPITLQEMRKIPELRGMKILTRGNRLSITPVTEEQYFFLEKYSENPCVSAR